ncbi:hypothetical protein Pmani_016499 [Petrolisthes manimaculis]|uniref:non-specific serine/threonine protein kinase n=1 Tax=Petrolisthes manimaculis TaxID=1843537 RepID=A0AAE1U6B4_9EUCA|nr:hypothetical protein Pmani_016499 [Petrolisthes manimaculis]
MTPGLDTPISPASPRLLRNPTKNSSGAEQKWRLLLVSSRARHVSPIAQSILPGVLLVTFKYETSKLDHILGQVSTALGGRQVESIGLVLHGSEVQLHLCGPGEKLLSANSVVEDSAVRGFFTALCGHLVAGGATTPALHLLAAHPAHHPSAGIIENVLQELLQIPVILCPDLQGTQAEVEKWIEGGDARREAKSAEERRKKVGEMYFDLKRLKESLKTAGGGVKGRIKDLETDYEKIRTVGKGAFGSAVLYRRREDDTLVIIKEINMLELSGAERQMSLNEINVLAMLDHPNIVSYMDSFERDTVLCIEMEYADGGSLAQYLTQRVKRIDEREILMIFHQITSAITYMHQHHILHRDLKTANIFLTKEGMVKVGDFGISKMMNTQSAHAHTVLGTPYYISPEMCEGKVYDEKSDIWALGCILYEMACLQKTFEGSNLPALVNKIMKGQFAPIKGNYSPGFKQLVRDLLQRDPEFRPTAAEVVRERLPELLAQFEYSGEAETNMDEELRRSIQAARQTQASRSSRPPRSVVYHLKAYDSSVTLSPVPLPPRTRVKELAVSTTHIILLTSEFMVYTWGEGRRGQLGGGSLENWRGRPGVVECLKGKGITRVAAGQGFSVFASDNGIVMTCGDGTFGCLGHGDWNSSAKPMLIELGEEVVVNVRCGGDGTILLTDQGALLSCGANTNNKLALNPASSFFSVKFKKEVDKALIATRVRSIGCRVVDVAMGPSHTAVLTETGQVLTFGRNCEGQLGRGNTRSVLQPVLVKSMTSKVVTMIQCGSTFTVAGTLENTLYLWGTRAVSPLTRPNTQEGFSNTWGQRSVLGSAVAASRDPDFHFDLQQKGENSGVSCQDKRKNSEDSMAGKDTNKETNDKEGNENSDAANKEAAIEAAAREVATRHQRDIKLRDVLLQPQEILALYASPSQIAKGETVNLASLHCQNQSVFVVIDTTVPLPRAGGALPPEVEDAAGTKKGEKGEKNKTEGNKEEKESKEEVADKDDQMSDNDDDNDDDDNGTLMDSMGPVPDWLKAELDEAENVWPGGVKVAVGKKQSRKARHSRKSSPNQHNSNNTNKLPASSEPARSPFVPSPRPGRGREGGGDGKKKERKPKNPKEKKKKEDQEEKRMAKEKEEALNQEIEKLRSELHRQQQQQKNIIDQKLREIQAEESGGKDSAVCRVM